MRNLLPIAVLTVAMGFTSGLAMAEQCNQNSVDLRGDWGRAHFSVEIADDAAGRAQGLMYRKKMASSAGMLFIYDAPHRASFWMRNTLIPLDMIFLDKTGRITNIKHNAQPLDETPIDGGDGVLMILEINGGMAKALGIRIGSQMRHPAIDAAVAVWSCANSDAERK